MTYMANINGAAIEGKSDMPQYVTLIKFKIAMTMYIGMTLMVVKYLKPTMTTLIVLYCFFQSHIMDGIYVLCQSMGNFAILFEQV